MTQIISYKDKELVVCTPHNGPAYGADNAQNFISNCQLTLGIQVLCPQSQGMQERGMTDRLISPTTELGTEVIMNNPFYYYEMIV